MKKKRNNMQVRVCEVCGNEIYKYRAMRCPYCGKDNKRVHSLKEAVTVASR